MNIGIDIRLLGRGTRSGIEEYTGELVSRLIGAPHQFDLFYNGRAMAPLPESFSQPNVRVINWSIPNRLVEASMHLFGWPNLRSDVFFSPHFNFIKTSAPHIMTFHDLSFLHHKNFFSAKQRFWHNLQSYKTQAKKSAHIIAVSEFTKSDIVNFLKIPEEKISVIYSGIGDEFRVLPPDNPAMADFIKNRQLNFPFILYLGTIEPRKNIPALIRAFNILKQASAHHDLRLVIAGAPGWLYQSTLKEAARSPAKNHIIFLGPIAPAERVFLYNKCRCFVYPSFFEGFGFPPLEAQKCGAPVVAAFRTSIPEVLADSAPLIDPWRVEDLALAIDKLLENMLARKFFIDKGLANATRFSWADSTQKTLKILEKYGARK